MKNRKTVFLLSVMLAVLFTNIVYSYDYFFSKSDTVKSKRTIQNDASEAYTDTTVVRDTLKALFQKRVMENVLSSNVLTRKLMLKYDYRYTGGLAYYLPYGFVQELGSLGQPNEVQFFGLGYDNISYLNDGIEINNRWQNAFNPYSLQMESIDTLQLLPVTSGFMFSAFNNPVVLNVSTRDKIDKQAYSKIRFYQAPHEEGLVDVMFSAYLLDRTNISFEATNRSIDSKRQTTSTADDYNSDYSSWLVNGKVHYMLSNSFNLIGTYRHERSQVGLFGGVYNGEGMYDPNTADVLYNDRFLRTVKNEVSLKLLSEFGDFSCSDLSLYYQYNRNEFKQNKDGSNSLIPRIENYHISKTTGVSLIHRLNLPVSTLTILGNYESLDLNTQVLTNNKVYKKYSLGGKLDLKLFDAITPSGYAKYLNFEGQSYFGFGGEVNIKLPGNLRVFGGLSYFEKPHSVIGLDKISNGSGNKEKIKSFQATLEHNGNVINMSLTYFVLNNDAALVPVILQSDSLINTAVTGYKEIDVTRQGLNLLGNIHLWKVLVESNLSYYFNLDDNKLFSSPELTFAGGVYYVDTLFHTNLYLKAGINYKFIGAKDYSVIDFEQSRAVFYQGDGATGIVEPIKMEFVPWSQQVDIFIAGTIQEKATVYFVFENLLDEQYYAVPYYPMNSQGIRLGISWEFLD